MNCKPGDLAVMVMAELQENIGLICRVLSRVPPSLHPAGWYIEHMTTRTVFGITKEGVVMAGGRDWQQDSWLRPIRDSDGTDETLREKELAE